MIIRDQTTTSFLATGRSHPPHIFIKPDSQITSGFQCCVVRLPVCCAVAPLSDRTPQSVRAYIAPLIASMSTRLTHDLFRFLRNSIFLNPPSISSLQLLKINNSPKPIYSKEYPSKSRFCTFHQTLKNKKILLLLHVYRYYQTIA